MVKLIALYKQPEDKEAFDDTIMKCTRSNHRENSWFT